MSRPKKLPKLDIPRETFDRIVLLLVSLQSVAAVKTACIEKLGLTDDQAEAAIEHAKKAIIDAAEIDKDKARGEAILRLNDLYERSLRVQDVKSALAAQKELNRLLGLLARSKAAEEGTAGTGTLGAIIAGRLNEG